MIVDVFIADIVPSYIEYVRSCAWQERAACRGVDPALFFPETRSPAESKAAIRVCKVCPVQELCEQYAFISNEKEGVWGGHTVRQRRLARKKWKAAFEQAGADYPTIPRPRSYNKKDQDADTHKEVKRRTPYIVEYLGSLPGSRLDDSSGKIITLLAQGLHKSENTIRAAVHAQHKAGLIDTVSRPSQGTFAIWLTPKGVRRIGLVSQSPQTASTVSENGSEASDTFTSTHSA